MEKTMMGDWAEFRRGRGPDKRPRKRRGIGAGLAVAGLGTLGLGGAGAAIATAPSGAQRKVSRTISSITQKPQSSLLGDASDPEYLEKIQQRRLDRIGKAAGDSDEAGRIYGQIMRDGKASPEQRKTLTRIAKKQGKVARRAKITGLVRRFGNRKALIGLGVGAGASAVAGIAYGAGRRKPQPSYYDYY